MYVCIYVCMYVCMYVCTHHLVVLWQQFIVIQLYITYVIRGYSSVVELSTADREVRGSTPRVPFFFPICYFDNFIDKCSLIDDLL